MREGEVPVRGAPRPIDRRAGGKGETIPRGPEDGKRTLTHVPVVEGLTNVSNDLRLP